MASEQRESSHVFTFHLERRSVRRSATWGKPMSVLGRRVIAVALDEYRPPEEASRALTLALDLAVRATASLLIVRISHDADHGAARIEGFTDVIDGASRALPGRIIVRTVTVDPTSAGQRSPDGSEIAPSEAGEAFVATAAGFGAGLLVVAASSELFPLDGVVGAVVSAAEVPTVVVPPGLERLEDRPFHVVVALDGVPQAGHVAEQISELHGWFQASVSLLHVLHPGGGRLDGVASLAHDRAAQMLQRSAACLGARGVEHGQIHVVVRSGPTSGVIVDHLRREHATLGVLPVVAPLPGHRRQRGVTSAVLATSHVPIVLLHAWDDPNQSTAALTHGFRH